MRTCVLRVRICMRVLKRYRLEHSPSGVEVSRLDQPVAVHAWAPPADVKVNVGGAVGTAAGVPRAMARRGRAPRAGQLHGGRARQPSGPPPQAGRQQCEQAVAQARRGGPVTLAAVAQQLDDLLFESH